MDGDTVDEQLWNALDQLEEMRKALEAAEQKLENQNSKGKKAEHDKEAEKEKRKKAEHDKEQLWDRLLELEAAAGQRGDRENSHIPQPTRLISAFHLENKAPCHQIGILQLGGSIFTCTEPSHWLVRE